MEINILQQQDEYTCSICQQRLTLFGSKNLKDGILCRNCAQLISPWFTEKELTKKSVEEIQNHLAYRDNNLLTLQSFHPTFVVEGKYALLVDEQQQLFCIAKKKDLLKENPDVIPTSAISEVSFMDEKYMNSGNIDVYFEIKLKGCQIKKIRFRVNEFPGMEVGSQQHYQARAKANELVQAFTTKCGFECNKLQFRRR